MSLEKLHFSFVLFCCLECFKSAQVSAATRPRIPLDGIETVFAGAKFANHLWFLLCFRDNRCADGSNTRATLMPLAARLRIDPRRNALSEKHEADQVIVSITCNETVAS